MPFLKDLFRRPVRIPELRVALAQVERERRRKLADLRRLGARQEIALEKIRDGRRTRNSLEVDYQWEEIKALRSDLAYARRETRVLNLEAISLKRYVRALERIEKEGDRMRARHLLSRIRSSDLERKLAAQEVKEEEYLTELDSIFDEIGLEVQALQSEGVDPEKDRFLADLDAMISAEATGDDETAVLKEERVKALVDPGE